MSTLVPFSQQQQGLETGVVAEGADAPILVPSPPPPIINNHAAADTNAAVAASTNHAALATAPSTMINSSNNDNNNNNNNNGAKFTVKDNWMAKYQMLENYHAQHGNSTVPCHFRENPSLGKWVSKQRTQYKLLKDGKKSQLTEKRIALLERLDFQWKATTCEWGKRYEELVQYKQQHGDTKVPHNYAELPKLGRWVVNIRWQYKLFQQGSKSHLTADRVKMLDDLQFEWKVRDDSGSWMRQFESLKQYHSEHGNTLVPNEYKDIPALGRWVTKQRGQYKQFQLGKPSQLTAERIDLLNGLNFEWNPFEADWRKCYNQLEEYSMTHGNCKVPFDYKENPFLGKWVSRQRWQYKLHQEKKASQLTPERIALLEKIGFDWRASTSDWTKRYQELCDYIDAKGHSLVPFDYPENRALGRWVSKQRTQYRLFVQNKPSQLTQERIAMLSKQNFEWNANQAKWMAHYVELEEHLSFVPPGQKPTLPRHSQNQALRRWIEKQRRDPSKLTDKRRKLLENLGFPWPDEAVVGSDTPMKKPPPEMAMAGAEMSTEDSKPAASASPTAVKDPSPIDDSVAIATAAPADESLKMDVEQLSSPTRQQPILGSGPFSPIQETTDMKDETEEQQQSVEPEELAQLVTDTGIKVVEDGEASAFRMEL